MILEYDDICFSFFENNKKKTILKTKQSLHVTTRICTMLEFTVYVYTIVLDKNRIMNIICTLI